VTVDVVSDHALSADSLYLQAKERPCAGSLEGPTVGIVDLFSGCGGMTLGAFEGARRVGRPATLELAVDNYPAALEVLGSTLDVDDDAMAGLDLAALLADEGEERAAAEATLTQVTDSTTLLLAGPPCQGHSALNNHSRHDDDRNDLYRAVARAADLLDPDAVIVENVRGVGRDRRNAVKRCTEDLTSLGFVVRPKLIDMYGLGAAQRRVRHVLVATRPSAFDFDELPTDAGRTLAWAIGDLEGCDGSTLFDTASVPTAENKRRIDFLFDEKIDDLPNPERPECHRSDHSYGSMYGRLKWSEPAQTITSGFGSMGQGRFVHPLSRRTLTPHEAARLQFLPDFVDFDLLETRSELATLIGNAVPPILMIRLVSALIDQGLL